MSCRHQGYQPVNVDEHLLWKQRHTFARVRAHTHIPGEEKRAQVPNRYALTFCVKGVKCPSCGQDHDDSCNEHMFDFQLIWSCRAAVDGLRWHSDMRRESNGR